MGKRRRRIDKVEIAFPRKYLPAVNAVLRACEAADRQARRTRTSYLKHEPRLATRR